MRTLGIESSCDETSAAVVEDGQVISLIIASQSEIHARYHGVVPEIASRAHVEQIRPVVERALTDAGLDPAEPALDVVAATARPGLTGSLAVGITFAKTYAWTHGIPFVAVDHIKAHAFSAQLARPGGVRYPYLVLLVSGGHSLIGVSSAPDELSVLGATIDDACGEAYDKVSVFLGGGYPGGPALDRLAANGDPTAYRFPTPKLNHGDNRYDLSFSGLKTAVVHQLDRFRREGAQRTAENVAASFQSAAVGMLMDRLENAMNDTGIQRVVAGGGVAANSELRRRLAGLAKARPDLDVVVPPLELCMDNGAMIAALGGRLAESGVRTSLSEGVAARVPEFRRAGGVPTARRSAQTKADRSSGRARL